MHRADGSFTVVPRVALGSLSADALAKINAVVQEYSLAGVRLTAGQHMMIDGVSEDILSDVVARLGEVGDTYKYKVQACLGNTGCKFGQRDSMELARNLEAFLDKFNLPSKIKASVSGCSMCCVESMVRDIGLLGKNVGWTVSFGGNAGKKPRQADVLAEDVTSKEAFEIIGKALDFYAENARIKERTARFVERVGIDAVKAAVFDV
ncbi:nitrite reductase [Pseudodesulfovibrio sediminis]|nr:nitrite reductase [Pseudodesulfovibrio sediminis]